MPLLHHDRRPAVTAAVGNVPRQGVLLGVLAVAQLMVILDISAVNVALPDLARDLGIARSDIGWAITSYSLVFGSLLLLGGRDAGANRPKTAVPTKALCTQRLRGIPARHGGWAGKFSDPGRAHQDECADMIIEIFRPERRIRNKSHSYPPDQEL